MLFEHLNQGDDNSIRADGTQLVGQSFTPTTAHTLTRIRLKLQRQGNPGSAIISVRAADSGGLPTGGDLSVGSLDTAGITTSGTGEWYFVEMSPVELEAGKQYVLILHVPGGDASNRLNCRWDRTDPPYGGGTALYSWNGGQGWRTMPDFDLMFEEWGITGSVPTPTDTTQATPTDTPTTEPTPTDTPTTEVTPEDTPTTEPTPTDTPTTEPTPTDTPITEPTPTDTPTTEPTPTDTPTTEPTGSPDIQRFEYLNEGDTQYLVDEQAGPVLTLARPYRTIARPKLQRQGNSTVRSLATPGPPPTPRHRHLDRQRLPRADSER